MEGVFCEEGKVLANVVRPKYHVINISVSVFHFLFLRLTQIRFRFFFYISAKLFCFIYLNIFDFRGKRWSQKRLIGDRKKI